MFARALLAFLILPGIVAGVLPLVLISTDPWRQDSWSFGVIILGLGSFGLLWCVRDFYVAGKGTLAPWDPPKRLVVVGLYRYTRNPMYISVFMLVGGWALLAGSPLLGVYLILLTLAFHLRVLWHEEPLLSKQFPSEWAAYSAHVPRWLPRLAPWREPDGCP
jgi:protein-S-isoprenylcysteine O-methyltransferase Ste14